MILIVMGVSGSGKTMVGEALAARLGWPFLDADAFHPAANVAKMRRGEALTDADRWPWLDAMRAALLARGRDGESAVLACSALKRAYRERLAEGVAEVRWVYLRVTREVAAARVSGREDHFMPGSLVDSQFAVLEEPAEDEGVWVIGGEMQVDEVVRAVVGRVHGH